MKNTGAVRPVRSPFLRVVFALAGATAILAACINPGTIPVGGTLSVTISNHIGAKTLVPAISMTAASYAITGAGPGDAAFSRTTTGGTLTIDGLAFGDWSVTVDALNSEGTVIGSGQAAATVHTGQTTVVEVSVVPLSGTGTLSLTVGWTASQVETPSIQASLDPPSGSPLPLSFSITGSQATFSSTTIPTGYHTLTVQLMDGRIAVMGAVEIVRIVKGQVTSGSYTFANVNQPGGSLQVNITPALADPIPVSITGVAPTMVTGTSVTASASVGDGTGNVVYVWYLNGVSQATGPTYSFGGTLPAGYYRLDVTAYTTDGKRAGSASVSTVISAGSASIVHMPVSGLDFDVDAQGRIFAVSYDYPAQSLVATVVRRDGTPVSSNVLVGRIASPDAMEGSPQVNTSPASGTTLVSWAVQLGGNFAYRQFYARLFDADATAITPPFAWPAPVSGNYIFDAAIDDSGAFVLLWQDDLYGPNPQKAYLSVYDSRGQKQGDDILVDDTGKLGHNYGFHVVVNPGDGSGIITTQGHLSSPIYYKRFTPSHQLLDASFQEVPFSGGNNSSWYVSHAAGINRNGDFVIEWENYGARTMEACFFSWSGALRGHTVLGSLQGYGVDGFYPRHQRAEVLDGNFVMRSDWDFESAYTLWLYTPAGARLGSTTTAADATKLRANFGTTAFIQQRTSGDIEIGSLLFN